MPRPRKPPPFQNLDRMQPRSQRQKLIAPAGCTDPVVRQTVAGGEVQTDHIPGSVGCYRSNRHKLDD